MLPECKQSTSSCEIKLRELEIDSYSKILSVFRARGNLTNERRKLLKQLGSFLNISQERHRAEVRRVTNDQLLSSIASRLTGQDWTIDWHEEGKRIVPTPSPFSHFTVNTPFADYIASVASLGNKYVDLYNNKICDHVPNEVRNVEKSEANAKNTSEKWLEDVGKVFSACRQEKSRDVSIQTVKKKVLPKVCTYCQRRKELRKKRLEAKDKKINEKAEEAEQKKLERADIILPSGKQIVVENAFTDNSDDFCVAIIAQEVVVESEEVAGPSYSQKLEERIGFGSLIDSSVTLATPDFTGLTLDPSKEDSQEKLSCSPIQQFFTDYLEDHEMPVPPRIPRILNSGPRKKLKKLSPYHSTKHSSLGDRGFRNKGPDIISKEIRTHDTSCMLVGSSPAPVRYVRPHQNQVPSGWIGHGKNESGPSSRCREEIPRHRDNKPKPGISRSHEILRHHEVPIKYLEESPSINDFTSIHRDISTLTSKNRENNSTHPDVILKHQEYPSKQDTVPKYHIDMLGHHEINLKQQEPVMSKPPGGIYKHYVRVRHAPKGSKSYHQQHIDHQSTSTPTLNFGETVEIPMEYVQGHHSDIFSGSMEVIKIDDIKVKGSHQVLESQQRYDCIGSLESVLHDHPSGHLMTSYNPSDSDDSLVKGVLMPPSQDPFITSNEGRSLSVKEDYPSRKLIKIFNGEKKVHGTIHVRTDRLKEMIDLLPGSHMSQLESNNDYQTEESATVTLDGVSLSGSEFIMEDVSIVDESSYPLVNGHEEIILEEEVLDESEILDSLEDKSEMCVIPQTDMKFSVVDITDFTGPLEHLHSVSSQSKDDSRDSDILINRQ